MQTTVSPGTREAVLNNLRTLLRDLFVASRQDVAPARLARAHGYTDGYMKALILTGVVTQRELATIVAEERAQIGAAPLRVVTEIDLAKTA